METINEFFQQSDIWKALFALAAGLVLGFEREMKDKSAGLKTITIITVGSALFAILSQNFSGSGDNFAIAAGIISGIGFLGAGVIFKEGFSIYGLTTAGVIWVAAAIGMAIGFGEFYIALVFLVATLIVIYGIQLVSRYMVPNYFSRSLEIEIDGAHSSKRKEIFSEIDQFANYHSITKTEKKDNNNLLVTADIHIAKEKLDDLELFLLEHEKVVTFKM